MTNTSNGYYPGINADVLSGKRPPTNSNPGDTRVHSYAQMNQAQGFTQGAAEKVTPSNMVMTADQVRQSQEAKAKAAQEQANIEAAKKALNAKYVTKVGDTYYALRNGDTQDLRKKRSGFGAGIRPASNPNQPRSTAVNVGGVQQVPGLQTQIVQPQQQQQRQDITPPPSPDKRYASGYQGIPPNVSTLPEGVSATPNFMVNVQEEHVITTESQAPLNFLQNINQGAQQEFTKFQMASAVGNGLDATNSLLAANEGLFAAIVVGGFVGLGELGLKATTNPVGAAQDVIETPYNIGAMLVTVGATQPELLPGAVGGVVYSALLFNRATDILAPEIGVFKPKTDSTGAIVTSEFRDPFSGKPTQYTTYKQLFNDYAGALKQPTSALRTEFAPVSDIGGGASIDPLGMYAKRGGRRVSPMSKGMMQRTGQGLPPNKFSKNDFSRQKYVVPPMITRNNFLIKDQATFGSQKVTFGIKEGAVNIQKGQFPTMVQRNIDVYDGVRTERISLTKPTGKNELRLSFKTQEGFSKYDAPSGKKVMREYIKAATWKSDPVLETTSYTRNPDTNNFETGFFKDATSGNNNVVTKQTSTLNLKNIQNPAPKNPSPKQVQHKDVYNIRFNKGSNEMKNMYDLQLSPGERAKNIPPVIYLGEAKVSNTGMTVRRIPYDFSEQYGLTPNAKSPRSSYTPNSLTKPIIPNGFRYKPDGNSVVQVGKSSFPDLSGRTNAGQGGVESFYNPELQESTPNVVNPIEPISLKKNELVVLKQNSNALVSGERISYVKTNPKLSPGLDVGTSRGALSAQEFHKVSAVEYRQNLRTSAVVFSANKEKEKQVYNTASVPIVEQENSLTTRSIPVVDIRSSLKLDSVSVSKFSNKQENFFKTRPNSEQVTGQAYVHEQIRITQPTGEPVSEQKPIERPFDFMKPSPRKPGQQYTKPQPPKPIEPSTPNKPFVFMKLPEGGGEEQFSVEVGKPGNKYYYNLGRGGKDLVAKGGRIARNTAAASVRVVPLTRGVSTSKIRGALGGGLYPGKNNRYIQPSKNRISSSGEKQQIPGASHSNIFQGKAFKKATYLQSKGFSLKKIRSML